MPRYHLTIEYDGTGYVGWQRQNNGSSIQAELERASAAINGQECLVYGAGRTDAGVHALGQVAHMDCPREWREDKLRDAMNAHLSKSRIAVINAQAVDDEFHARFSATNRHYLYRILNRRPPPVIELNHVWWVKPTLDHEAMHEAAKLLLGQHDFTTFRSVQCQAKSPIKTLDKLSVSRFGDTLEITANARSFLHNQVRSLVGSLVQVGRGRWSGVELQQALRAKDRSACGPVAPPDGLFLMRVDYGQ